MQRQLLKLSRAEGTNGETDSGSDILINPINILMVEDSHPREPGHSKIVLTNGKILYVEETQNDIYELANEDANSLI